MPTYTIAPEFLPLQAICDCRGRIAKMYATDADVIQTGERMTLVERLNGPRHELALRAFLVIVLAHWAEHLVQAFQIYGLGWPPPRAGGVLGYFFPWLIKSETLH